MEDIVSCEICGLEYSDTELIPRVLDCGHTFCTSCITQLNNAICPKCRANILVGREFPVNYSLLNLVEECKLEKDLSEDIVSSIDNLQEKLNSKLSVINKMSEICSKKETIEIDLLLLNSMKEENLNEEYGNKKEMRIRKKLRKLQEKYKNFSLVNYLYFDDLDQFSSFSLQNSDTQDFLEQIYRALKNSEKVFSFKCIEKKLKFGELTVRDDKILIHSLSLDEIPKGSKIVQFADLRCPREKPFRSFFEISGKKDTTYMIIIHLHDTNLVPRFIKMCTAEKGSSTYKNLPFCKGENRSVNEDSQSTDHYGRLVNKQKQAIALESIIEVNILEDLQPDYKNNESTVACSENDIIVTEKSDKLLLQIFRVKKSGDYPILGKVKYPSDFWNHLTYDDASKILDCGLVIEI